MTKKILTLAALMALSHLASASPAKRYQQKVRQSDGTTLTVALRGDEHMHYFTTLDGVPVMRTATGDFTYARFDGGQLTPTSVLAHSSAQRTPSELQFKDEAPSLRRQLSALRTERLLPINQARAKVAQKRRLARAIPMRDAAQENKKGLIILVNFKDLKMQETSTPQVFDRFANTDGLTGSPNYGSIHDYFKAQSYGRFNVTFDIAGPYTVSQDMAYYGGNDRSGNDKNPEAMVYEAVQMADADVNFADYDWDGDGEVENIYVVYAGYGEASGADENTIWPHQYQLSATYRSSQLTFDGVRVDTYACGSELMGDGYAYDEDGYPIEDAQGNYIPAESGELDGVGTMCHEFSHCLGLPDFYDTDYNHFGMDVWSVMDKGCNNDSGYSPANYTAYERWFSGWLEPIELKEPTIIQDMPALANEPVAYIIYNDKDPNEYYLLQNTQPISFDRGNGEEASSFGHGLMIQHVTYNEAAWYQNTVNNSVQRMTIIPADGELYGQNDAYADIEKAEQQYYRDYDANKYYNSYYNAIYRYYNGLACDLWPNATIDGKQLNQELTDDSTPAATLNNANTDGKKLLHKPITAITETPTGTYSNGLPLHTISFKFMGGKVVAAPTDLTAKDITASSFTAMWTASADAVLYRVQLRQKSQQSPAESVLLTEDFSSLTSTGDGTTDLAASLDDYTATPGWTGEKIYKGAQGCKVGNRNGGYLMTPLLTPATGELTILLHAVPFNNDADGLTVELVSENGTTLDSRSAIMGEEGISLIFEVGQPCRVKLTPARRAYVSAFTAYDGSFLLEDLASVKQMAAAQTFATTATNHTFTDLTPGSTYAFRVCAVDADGIESEWTPWTEVELGAVGIAATKADNSVPLWLDLQGRPVTHPTAGRIYLRRQNGQTEKVLR